MGHDVTSKEYKNRIKLIMDAIHNIGFIAHITQYDDWTSLTIMHNEGKFACRIFWYHEDSDSIYLSDLSVNEDLRRRSIGTRLQRLREKIGIKLGATAAYLWVNKDSWQHDWYERRGYVYYDDYYDEENIVWMKKDLSCVN